MRNIHVKLHEIWTSGSGRRCRLKTFLIKSYGSPFVQWTGTICAILEEGIMRNNPVKLFRILTSGSGESDV